MQANPNEHIESAELARLLEESRQCAGSLLVATDVHPHFAVCVTCREQFEGLASLERQLDRQLKNTRSAAPALQGDGAEGRPADCPSPAVWREIAGGLTPPGQTLAYIDHASRCDFCGPRLHEAVAELTDLNGEITDAERKHLAALESASPEWQRQLAQQIVGKPPRWNSDRHWTDRESTPWWQRWWTTPRLAMAGVSLLAVVAVGSWVAVRFNESRNQSAAAGRLLARAYTEKRTLELRIAGADYAPMRVSLGSTASFASRPAALLKAEALIATQLESHPTDPSWLQAKAQADVLEGKYDAAVEALRHALQLEPHSPTLLTDLATAYFQRAQQEDRKEDLGAAYEYLSQALNVHPDDPVALFNRAIVAEHQFLYQQALEDWDHYIRVDPASQWGEEARNRAEALREKLKQHESGAKPLLSPAQIAAAATSAGLGSQVDQRVEEYLHEAVRSWLPQAFPEARTPADPSASQALFFLADLTAQQHGDRWLADLLQGSAAPNFPQAANALARAVQANDAAGFVVSREQAHLAEKLFGASGNSAGALRAEFEQTLSAQASRRSEDCRRRSITARAESMRYAYPWLQIQFGLEESVCSVLMGDPGTYEKAARIAMDRAQQVGYGALYLRALGFEAEGKFDTGDRSGGWKLVCTGLERYWSGQFPAMRGYNLYTFEANAVEAAGQSSLEVAIWREAAATIDTNENLLIRASAHSNMAKAARVASQPEVAERQYAEAVRLYALAPQTEATRADRLDREIMTAQLETHQSAFDDALARLTRLQDEVRQLSNNYLAQIFYSTLAEVQLRSHHAAEAELSFRPALRLAEQNLASLTSEADRTSWSKDAAPVYLGLGEAELLQGREQEALDMFEWYLGAPQRVGVRQAAASKTSSEPWLPSSLPLSARLPLLSDQTVIAYGVLPDGLAIWVYDNRGVTAKWIPKSPQELQDLAADFYAQCSDPNSEMSALRRDSQALYSLLISPVEAQLDPRRTLVIETEGFLDRLPFEALIDSSGQYLIARGPIVHSPGLYAEARMHPEKTISSDLPTLIVGSAASSPATGLFAAPSVAAGADAVATGFHSPRVLTGPDATLAAVRNALPAAAVFHFAGHSITTSAHTGLMLRNGGKEGGTSVPVLLDANFVRSVDLRNMQLAVLAACSTDSGEGASRGFDSVAETLQTSGVPHVVASRWAVDSVEANAFVGDFYRSLLSGQPVSNATRMTAQKMLLNPLTAHPYHWAAFAAYGRS